VDIDGDGNRDILSGSYSRLEKAMAGLFQVLHGNANGTFRTAEALKGTDGEPLIIPIKDEQQRVENICTRPFAADWDSDGRLDLVVGNFSGTFYWFQGEGKGKFQPQPEAIKSGEAILRIAGNHSDPFVIDWDGDGDLDLVSGSSSGGVQWAENTAGKGEVPELGAFEWLIQPGADPFEDRLLVSENDLSGPLSSTRVWVADVNVDGKLDLLVGDSVTLRAPAEGLSEAEFKKKFADWQKAFAVVREKLTPATSDEAQRTKAFEDYRKVYEQRATFMREEQSGFVWLYLRK